MKKFITVMLAISAIILTGCSQNQIVDEDLPIVEEQLIVEEVVEDISQPVSQNNGEKTDPVQSLAKCLTEKGAVIYSTKTCPYCQRQKALFGDSREYLTSVDCNESPDKCGNIRGVPHRDINGEGFSGLRSLEQLAEIAGCDF